MKNPDVYIKKEKDYFNFIFSSEKAKERINEEIKTNNTVKKDMFTVTKEQELVFPVTKESKDMFVGVLISWDLKVLQM